ncbi:SUF system Fe-S cluster assembly regulator [Haliangium sp.]
MLRISKLTDYAVALSVRLAQAGDGERQAGERHQSVRSLARATRIPEPTVRKVLKTLVKAGLVRSVRGAQGGYGLARPANEISVAEIIVAVEGPIGVTECTNEATAGLCELEGRCTVQGPWQQISAVIRAALSELNLADMVTDPDQTSEPPPVRLRLRGDERRPGPPPPLPFAETLS